MSICINCFRRNRCTKRLEDTFSRDASTKRCWRDGVTDGAECRARNRHAAHDLHERHKGYERHE